MTHSDFPSWIEVLHPAQLVIPTGQIPLTLSELRQQCHSRSERGKEGPALKSQGMQVGHAGKVRFDAITGVAQAQSRDHTVSRLQGGHSLPAEGLTLSGSC